MMGTQSFGIVKNWLRPASAAFLFAIASTHAWAQAKQTGTLPSAQKMRDLVSGVAQKGGTPSNLERIIQPTLERLIAKANEQEIEIKKINAEISKLETEVSANPPTQLEKQLAEKRQVLEDLRAVDAGNPHIKGAQAQALADVQSLEDEIKAEKGAAAPTFGSSRIEQISALKRRRDLLSIQKANALSELAASNELLELAAQKGWLRRTVTKTAKGATVIVLALGLWEGANWAIDAASGGTVPGVLPAGSIIIDESSKILWALATDAINKAGSQTNQAQRRLRDYGIPDESLIDEDTLRKATTEQLVSHQ